MITEVATMELVPDNDGFEGSFGEALELFLVGTEGYRAHRQGRRVEPPAAYVVQIDWDDVESHRRFVEAKGVAFVGHFERFLAQPPTAFHFDIGDGQPSGMKGAEQ